MSCKPIYSSACPHFAPPDAFWREIGTKFALNCEQHRGREKRNNEYRATVNEPETKQTKHYRAKSEKKKEKSKTTNTIPRGAGEGKPGREYASRAKEAAGADAVGLFAPPIPRIFF